MREGGALLLPGPLDIFGMYFLNGERRFWTGLQALAFLHRYFGVFAISLDQVELLADSYQIIMSWVLFEENENNAWSIVHEKNVLRAGSDAVEVGEEYTYFYRGGRFTGKALEVDGKFSCTCISPSYVA